MSIRMRGPCRAVLVFVAVAMPAMSWAQSIPRVFVTDVKDGALDMLALWVSPFRGSPRDYATAGAVVAGFGVLMFADEPVADWMRTHQHVGALRALKPFRDDSPIHIKNIGTAPIASKGALAVYAVGLILKKPGLRDAGMGCVASFQGNALPRGMLAYRFVSRERPLYQEIVGIDTTLRPGNARDVHTPGTDSWWDNSFFGGHVTNAMACASFLNHRFHLRYAEPVIWLIAGGVGAGRMADQRHWLSDSALGAAFGFAVGKFIAERSLARRDKRDGEPAKTGSPGAANLSHTLLDGLYFANHGAEKIFGWRAVW
jgi:membrane-associated phospholipid phosphatase